MSLGPRIGLGIVGVVVLVVGFMARSFEQETSSLGYRVLEAPNGVVGAYQPDESLEGPLEIIEAGEGDFSVVSGQSTVFTGSEQEAAFWIETRGAAPAFTGTTPQVEAWVAEQEAAEDNGFWSVALMVVGGLLVLTAVGFGGRWNRAGGESRR